MKDNLLFLGENAEKYITFSVSVEKEVTLQSRIYWQHIMASSLLNLVDNFCEGIYKIKCKNEHSNKKCQTCGIKYKDCE